MIDRRTTLKGIVGLAVACAARQTLGKEEKDGWVDAHSHIWTSDTDRFPLVAGLTKKDLAPASFTDDELMAVASPEGVTRVVLIQHSVYHLFDNSYCIDAARRHPSRFRVVGMIDDHQPGAGQRMKELLEQRVTGFRITPFIRKENPKAWLTTPGMREMWKTAATTRQAMCCLIGPDDLPDVAKMCEANPETPVVIDHFARIGMDGEIRDADVASLCALERYPHTKVKVSAFYALGKKKPPHDELVPMIKRLYETFGPQRLMWASDAPYQLEGENSYAASIALVRDKLAFLSADDREWLLRKTAEETFFYQ
jgi:predicted TIM-barrel fold metal-dependent hydrolase